MELLIARNPDPESSLGYLLRLPLGHPMPLSEWPTEPELVERVSVRACTRRGANKPVRTDARALACGDYGVALDGRLMASVERRSLTDLVTSLTTGRLRYALGELARGGHGVL